MTTELACACGKVRLAVEKSPITSAECHCNSCREAGARLASLPLARPALAPNGGTPFVVYRKDRVRILAGSDLLGEFRLTPKSTTRRVVATCCNTPVFLEFKGSHWLSLYGSLWPEGTMPALQLRTMVGDRKADAPLAGDLPSGFWPTAGFYAELLGAWIAMGFRSPQVAVTRRIEL